MKKKIKVEFEKEIQLITNKEKYGHKRSKNFVRQCLTKCCFMEEVRLRYTTTLRQYRIFDDKGRDIKFLVEEPARESLEGSKQS